MDRAERSDIGEQEVTEEGLQVAGREDLRGRPVLEDGPGDRQLPGKAALVRGEEEHAPSEEWPGVADPVPGHLRKQSDRSELRGTYWQQSVRGPRRGGDTRHPAVMLTSQNWARRPEKVQ